jgi:hypothetical protein
LQLTRSVAESLTFAINGPTIGVYEDLINVYAGVNAVISLLHLTSRSRESEFNREWCFLIDVRGNSTNGYSGKSIVVVKHLLYPSTTQ